MRPTGCVIKTSGDDMSVIVNNRVNQEIERRNMHIEVMRMRQAELIKKNNRLQAEKIKELKAKADYENDLARFLLMLFPPFAAMALVVEALAILSGLIDDIVAYFAPEADDAVEVTDDWLE